MKTHEPSIKAAFDEASIEPVDQAAEEIEALASHLRTEIEDGEITADSLAAGFRDIIRWAQQAIEDLGEA